MTGAGGRPSGLPPPTFRQYPERVNARDERLARNETIFREVNERVASVADNHLGEPIRYAFLCECSDTGCFERVDLTLGEYESVRATPTWFVIALGHELTEIEQVVRRNDEYQVVQKLGELGEAVAASDPRR
jgi:hypothetical protein